MRSDGAQVQSARSVEQAIAQAAQRSGTDFGFLLAQAKVESGLDPRARAQTSSATGLFQFIDSTWLRIAERHGSALGLASQLDLGDPATRRDVLALRNDAGIASQMAAALVQENSAILQPALGREPDAGELYLAHFLGAGEATRFLGALERTPDAMAAPLFAQQAAANRAIFFDGAGASRSVTEVMDILRSKIERAMPTRGSHAANPPPATSIAARRSAPPLPVFQNRPAVPLSKVLETQFQVHPARNGETATGDLAGRVYARLKAFGL